MAQLEETIKKTLESICNTKFDDIGWIQASLPIRLASIGVRSPLDLALPAYLSSVNSCQALTQVILRNFPESREREICKDAEDVWKASNLDVPSSPNSQHSWDEIQCRAKLDTLRPVLDQHKLACLSAASQPHSGDWLYTLPSLSTGTKLDDACLRISICHRLGLTVCEPHPCRCGQTVDSFGLHPLSCLRSAGRHPRHTALNDVIRRALDSAGIPSILEPEGLDRGDGKRPDGITVFPYLRGRSLIWDATCTDTFSSSMLVNSAVNPGSAANAAEERKIAKYGGLLDRYVFTPVAVETSGVIGKQSLVFLRGLARRVADAKNDPREAVYLFQRISLAIVRGNASAVLAAGLKEPKSTSLTALMDDQPCDIC